MENIQPFKRLLESSKDIVIVTHFKPDADALGSSLGLAGFLRKKGHSVLVVTPSDYPGFLTWMPGNEGVLALSTCPLCFCAASAMASDTPALAGEGDTPALAGEGELWLAFSQASRYFRPLPVLKSTVRSSGPSFPSAISLW